MGTYLVAVDIPESSPKGSEFGEEENMNRKKTTKRTMATRDVLRRAIMVSLWPELDGPET